MTDFKKIDFETYNNPPFLPQYLARGETKKLVSFDDGQLEAVDDTAGRMAERYDLGEIRGFLLDRLGKLKDAPRDGRTDDVYRTMIRLRTLLDTTNGSVNDIIKTIKFLYSSEIIRIVPDYPAGMIIERDGEGTPGLDFNSILAEVVPAGVSYSTKELFEFVESVMAEESQAVTVNVNPTDEFAGRIRHNRRILRDGKTIFPTELRKAFRNGVLRYDGTERHKRLFEAEAADRPSRVFLRNSGYLDEMAIVHGMEIGERLHSRLLHNGGVSHGGGFVRRGSMPAPAHDLFSFFRVPHSAVEVFDVSESVGLRETATDADTFAKRNLRNGKLRRGAGLVHARDAVDSLSVSARGAVEFTETVLAEEDVKVGYRLCRSHDGLRFRDGGIKHDSGKLYHLENIA